MNAMRSDVLRCSVPVITVLSTRANHPTMRGLIDISYRHGIAVRCQSVIDPASTLVMPWGYRRLTQLAGVRAYCSNHGIDQVNISPLGKWEQLVRLAEANLPIPNSRRAENLAQALAEAELVRYPVIIKPNWGSRSKGVELVQNENELVRAWTDSHRILQTYLPEGFRCTRILVIGMRVVYAVTRIAKDGLHATYDHGRRGMLEPYTITPERAELAVAACAAVGVEVGGVDIVETRLGPCILEVNHVCIELSDKPLHGPNAVNELAEWLAERVRVREKPFIPHSDRWRLRMVTRQQDQSKLGRIRKACTIPGFDLEIARNVDPTADCTWLFGLNARQRWVATRRLAALPISLIGGSSGTAWANRGRLFRSGIAVSRSRLARDLNTACKIADEFDYPLTLRVGYQGRPRKIVNAEALRAAWPPREPARCILEPNHYATMPRMRIWVAGERAFRAARVVRGRHFRIALRQAPCELAIEVCRTLNIQLGFVDVVLVDGEPIVMHACASDNWVANLNESAMRAALNTIAHFLQSSPVQSRRSRCTSSTTQLLVLLARDKDQECRTPRMYNIHALYRELVRRGHRVLFLNGRADAPLLADADIVLQDPLQTFGFGRNADSLDRFLYENAAQRCHLLRRFRRICVDKSAMHTEALSLAVRAPRLYSPTEIEASHFPIIAKPRFGSLGFGVRLIESIQDLHSLTRPSRLLLQQFVDSKTSFAISLRVVTVVDRIVAAALFYNPHSICSNLARGGRAIPLSGPGKRLGLLRKEKMLLEAVRIDPDRRDVPTEVIEMAGRIGYHYSQRGAQMMAQDFAVDSEGKWYFLEVNLGFGTAVFNATDGEGFASFGRGLVHAGRVLADAIEARFSRRGANTE
jgi:glutathione synthase/RimK-type ligase-like ATP-grasp enzyme